MKVNFDSYIELLKEKDNHAFEVIYNATKRGVFAMIISLVYNREVTEDLMQETYMKMLKGLHTYKKGKNFNAWVVQIAKNVAYDYLRSKKNTTMVSLDDNPIPLQSPHEDPLKAMMVEKAMNILSPEEKQIVLLHIFSEMTFKEIAELIQKPSPTIYWTYKQSISKMESHLRKE